MTQPFQPQFYPVATVPTGIAGPRNAIYIPINQALLPSYVPGLDFTTVTGVLLVVTRGDLSTVNWIASSLIDVTAAGLVAVYVFSLTGVDCPFGNDGAYKIRPWLKIAPDVGYTIPCSTAVLTVVNAVSPPIIPSLVSIAVTPANVTSKQGFAQQYTAIGTFTDSSTQDLTATATWTSASTAVASVVPGGLASCIGGGTTNIKATLGGVHGQTSLSVVQLIAIAVTPANATIGVG